MSGLPAALDVEEDADVLGADGVGVVRVALKLPRSLLKAQQHLRATYNRHGSNDTALAPTHNTPNQCKQAQIQA